MRYFRYDGPTQEDALLKLRLQSLTQTEKNARRRAKWLHALGTAVFWVVFLGVLVGCAVLFSLLKPTDDSWITALLFCIGRAAAGLVGIIIGGIVGSVAALPLWNRHETAKKQLRKEILRDASAHLREFYGFCEPFLVTKCFASTDRKFNRHDVCLFIVDGELRITGNLHYGFFHPEKDLGCYALKKGEITLQNTHHKDRPAVDLIFGDTVFCLSRNATPFIRNYLTETSS